MESFRQFIPTITDVKLIEQERREKADQIRKKREETKVTDAVEKASDKYNMPEETMFEGNGIG